MLIDFQRRVVDAVMIIFRAVKHDSLAFKGIRVFLVSEIAIAEFFRNNAQLHNRRREQITAQHAEPGMFLQWIIIILDDIAVFNRGILAVFTDGLAVNSQRILMNEALPHQLIDDCWHTTRMVIIFTEIFTRWLKVDQQRNFLAIFLPVIDSQLHANVTRQRIQMDRRIGRTTNCRIHANCIDEGFLGHDVCWLQIFIDHLNNTTTSQIRDFLTITIRRWNCRRARQLHTERFGKRIHRRCRAHRVAIAGRGCRRSNQLDKARIVDLALGQQLTRLPDDGARTRAFATEPAIEHRTNRERNRRNIDGSSSHQAGRRGLVTTNRQHNAIERIAIKHFDKAEICEVAIKACSRTFAGFLDRMNRKFDHDTARFTHTFTHAIGQLQMMTVAR